VVTPTPLNILVVDDESPLRETLRQSFTREGHTVMAVPDGRSAIDRASTTRFDIVLLDIALGAAPDGFEVCRELRARDNVVPIIMLTALDSEAEAVLGLEAGADDYVTKPFGIDELLARIRAAQRHRLQEQGEKPIFRTGDLTMDLVRRVVTVRGKEVKFSPREYDLLRLLVSHAGKVLTHNMLLREVWGPNTDVQYLRIYIRALRQKIEQDTDKPEYIQTETGVGYRLRAPD
jgi:two-component system, OmpR family, KDP operon response regulator KdpE